MLWMHKLAMAIDLERLTAVRCKGLLTVLWRAALMLP